MPTITNQSSTTYQFEGSSDVLTVESNENIVNLQENQTLTMSKTATPTTYAPGSIITYRVTITNSTSSFLTGVRIIDNLGGGNLAYVIGSATLTTSTQTYPVTPIATNPLTFTLQQLNVGATMTLTYRAQVIFNLPLTVNTIVNTAQGIGYTSTGTVNGIATSVITRGASGGALTATKSANLTTVFPRQALSYTIRLLNESTTAVTTTITTDQLADNFVVTSVQVREGSGANITLDSTDYSISAGNLITVPSVSGPVITVPANGQTIITVNGYFE